MSQDSSAKGDLAQPFMVDDENYNGDELTEEEKGIMNEFQKNDEAIEEQALGVKKLLDELQGKTKKIGEAISSQKELLDKANSKAEKTEQTL